MSHPSQCLTVSAAITSSGSHFGGFIGHSITNTVTLRGCVFSGSLSGGTYVATFHGWSDDGATTTLIDCLDASASRLPIGRGTDAACVSNTYYFATKNFSNGERLWSVAKRGKQAYAVTAGEGVTIDFGATAETYGTTGIAAYSAGMAYREIGTLGATFYAAEGEVVPLDLAATPSFGMILDAYAASAGTLSQSGNAWTLAMPAQDVVLNATWQSATTLYPIGDVASWNAFANAVNGGMDTAGKYFVLTDEIGPVTNTVGTQGHPFCGTFDGGGYALIVNLSGTDDYVAPFSVIDGAVISNLVVGGTVRGRTYCSGLVGFAAGTNLVENCRVFAAVAAHGSNSGGIVGHGGTSATTIAGCLFDGGFSGALNVGTLWGWSDAGAAPVLIDCLDASYCSHPIGRGSAVSLRVENVYYLHSKSTTGAGPWPQDKNGKYAYSVTESRVTLDFGAPTATYATSGISAFAAGIWAYGGFYAGEGVSIDIAIAGGSSSATEGIGLWASAGSLVKSGGGWTLTMPDGDVTLSPLREIEDGAVLSGDFSDGLLFGIAAGAAVTLSNAVIEVSDAPGIICLGDAVIVLEGLNTVIGSYDGRYPGIQAGPTNTTLEISGGGSLTVEGGVCAAGIGSRRKSECGDIVISGGIIAATGGYGAAGIGSGEMSSCGNIVIQGGTITAIGDGSAAGIGSGVDGECDDIVISGGTIVATGGYKASGIGSGKMGSCGNITIGADVLFVTATCGDGGLNPIGAGVDGTCGTVTIAPDLTDETEDQTRRLSHPVTDTVTLTGESGEIRLTNGQTLVGEGNGNTHIVIAAGASVTFRDVTVDPDGRDARWAGVTCEGDAIITLVGTNSVTSSSGSTGSYSGIAVTQGHTLVIRGDGRLTASSKDQAGGIGNSGACGTIRIEGGDILAIGGQHGAGIGCYVDYGSCDAIVITGGRVRAVGGSEGAGIGAGNQESCGDITISSGVVYAQGGSCGAGIGSARGLRANMQSVCGNIVITGGVVTVVVSDNVNGTGNSATYDLDASGETVINETGKTRRFFRLRAVAQ